MKNWAFFVFAGAFFTFKNNAEEIPFSAQKSVGNFSEFNDKSTVA